MNMRRINKKSTPIYFDKENNTVKNQARILKSEKVTDKKNNRAALGGIENTYHVQTRSKSTSSEYGPLLTARSTKGVLKKRTPEVFPINKEVGKSSKDAEKERYKHVAHSSALCKPSTSSSKQGVASNYDSVSILVPMRSSSSGYTREDFKKAMRSQYVTTKRSWCGDSASDFDCDIFVPSKTHIINKMVNLRSPAVFQVAHEVEASPPTRSAATKLPLKKTTLVNKLCRRSAEAYYIGYDYSFCEYIHVSNVHVCYMLIMDVVYTDLSKAFHCLDHTLLVERLHGFGFSRMPEINDYLMSREYVLVLRTGFMEDFRNSTQHRAVIIDWLVRVQQRMDLSESVFMSTVKLLDLVLSVSSVKPQKFLLVAVACLWLMLKYDCSSVAYNATRMLGLCDHNYTVLELLTLEKSIFKSMRYNLRIDEPFSFLYYYIQRLRLQNNLLIIYAAHYVLETYALFPEFSTISPCLLAVATLYAVLLKWKNDKAYDLLSLATIYYDQSLIRDVADNIRYRILQAVHPGFRLKSTFNKYMTDLKMEASKYFARGGL